MIELKAKSRAWLPSFRSRIVSSPMPTVRAFLNFVQAYLWFDLSAARGYKDAIQVRETVSRRMTEAQIAEAQKLVRDWKPSSKPPALLLQ